jgi:hypothetical protein
MKTELTFQVAKIVYFTDVTRADARVIPLGSLSEILVPPAMHGLALKARSELSPDELALVSPLMRDRLQNPFAFLRADCDVAWGTAEPGRAIEFLGRRHTASLSVLAPRNCLTGLEWLRTRLLTPRLEAIDSKLSGAVEGEFEDLMKQYGRRPPAPRTESEIRKAA